MLWKVSRVQSPLRLVLVAGGTPMVRGVCRRSSGDPSAYGLAELIIAMTDSRSSLVFKTLPSDDPNRRQPDISLVRAKLGWEPKVDLTDSRSAPSTTLSRPAEQASLRPDRGIAKDHSTPAPPMPT